LSTGKYAENIGLGAQLRYSQAKDGEDCCFHYGEQVGSAHLFE
jgi:hypothetical protein